VNVVRSERYRKDLKRLGVSAKDIETMEREIAARPESGAIIRGLKGARKARFRIGNRGKSGGGRAIYYVAVSKNLVLMIAAYAKAEKEDLSPEDRKSVLQALKGDIG
jgi:mRNA-degrading endonuclease RelE of RelBE toxin-antitoxin system